MIAPIITVTNSPSGDDAAERRQRLNTALTTVRGGKPELKPIADAYQQFAEELQKSELGAKEKFSRWQSVQRAGVSATSAGAAAGGGALAAQLHGPSAVVFGCALLVLALFGAIVTGLSAEPEADRNRRKKRRYEQIWWELYVYVVADLPGATPQAAAANLVELIKRRADIGDPTNGPA